MTLDPRHSAAASGRSRRDQDDDFASRVVHQKVFLVGKGGVEPPRPFGHTDLNRARLPFRHLPSVLHNGSTEVSAGLTAVSGPDTITPGQ